MNNINLITESNEQFSDLKKWSNTSFVITKEEPMLITDWIDVIFSKPPHNVQFKYKDANINQQELISIPAGNYHRIDLLNIVSTKSGFFYSFDQNGVLLISGK